MSNPSVSRGAHFWSMYIKPMNPSKDRTSASTVKSYGMFMHDTAFEVGGGMCQRLYLFAPRPICLSLEPNKLSPLPPHKLSAVFLRGTAGKYSRDQFGYPATEVLYMTASGHLGGTGVEDTYSRVGTRKVYTQYEHIEAYDLQAALNSLTPAVDVYQIGFGRSFGDDGDPKARENKAYNLPLPRRYHALQGGKVVQDLFGGDFYVGSALELDLPSNSMQILLAKRTMRILIVIVDPGSIGWAFRVSCGSILGS
jgi:hypothetical protein